MPPTISNYMADELKPNRDTKPLDLSAKFEADIETSRITQNSIKITVMIGVVLIVIALIILVLRYNVTYNLQSQLPECQQALIVSNERIRALRRESALARMDRDVVHNIALVKAIDRNDLIKVSQMINEIDQEMRGTDITAEEVYRVGCQKVIARGYSCE